MVDMIARALALRNSNSYIFVENYNALLGLIPKPNQLYYCINSQGTKWLPGSLGGTYYPKGLYYFATTWQYAELPYQATQLEVNNGVDNDKFITPLTLKSSSLLSGKQDKNSWLRLATAFSTTPLFLTTISSGDVYEYKYTNNTITYYRLVPSSTANIDSFYENFSSNILSNLITNKQS